MWKLLTRLSVPVCVKLLNTDRKKLWMRLFCCPWEMFQFSFTCGCELRSIFPFDRVGKGAGRW